MDKKVFLLFIKKRGTQIDRFYEMFSNNFEVSLKDMKKVIARSTFHEILRKEITQINQTLNELNENIKLFEYSLIERGGSTFKAIRKNPKMNIISTTNHYVLRLEKEDQNE